MKDEKAYVPDESQAGSASSEPIEWTASEYIAHEKSNAWYVMLLVSSALITAVVYLITKEILAGITIMIVAMSAGFFAGRPPVSKKYVLSLDGIKVDEKTYDLGNFKTFSIVEEGAIDSIWLKQLGRFSPFLIIYFSPEDEDRIVSMLSSILPHEQRELDFIDRTMRHLRF